MYKYFTIAGDQGFKCSCGCGLGLPDMDKSFTRRLDKAREAAGVPFVVNSGMRCPTHNNRVSSTGYHGPHTTGKAVDIATPDSRTRFLVRQALMGQGFTRFGSHPAFVHVDDCGGDEGFDDNVEWWY